jgi:hypothetical protein
MASEREANIAREQFSQFLRDLGAHAIAVDEIKSGGRKSFAVVAYFAEKPAGDIPKSLEIKSGKKSLEVPLAVRVMEMFSPE